MTQDVSRFRWRLLAACVLLTGLAMTQSPGLIVPDTKLDLAIAPWDFLARAAHLWDGEGAFGQLQNQAYGYLWPMGPFFVLGALVELQAWVVQRLWLALVMCVACVGSARVARAMGVRSDLGCIVAGLAFALSPRMLTVLGVSSIEAWPSAVAPWVLLPLVIGAERGSPRRAAALSALAITMVGGVNAAATSAVLPLGAVWLLTRTPGPRRRQLMLWWPVLTLLGTLWWLVPLFLLGSYSPPFLDFIESASTTTIPTNLVDTLRGTSNWVSYIDSGARAGNDLLRDFYLPLNGAVLLLAGISGMLLRRNPHRVFLVSSVVVGMFLVSMGHVGSVQGWFAPTVQDLLDGPLAPLRNVHKFDVVLRLPLVIGLAWSVDALASRAGERTRSPAERLNHGVIAGVVAFSVLATATPAVVGRITPNGGFDSVPGYWSQAAAWLSEQDDAGVALLVPGSMFGDYVWGSPRDEPLQALSTTPWAVRNAVPLTPPGTIRMLDAIEDRIAQGEGSPGLASYMRRSGISHLVVRNDVAHSDDIADPVLVHQALAQTPGLEIAATFGPVVGGDAHLEGELGRALINGGWQNDHAAIEVYRMIEQPPAVTATDVSPLVVGGPEDLLDLADLGVIGEEPTQLAATRTGEVDPAAPVVLTDGYPAVHRIFGRLHDSTTQVLTREEASRLRGSASDYVLANSKRWLTYAEYDGIDDVRASSSLADPWSPGGSRRERLPFAALDGQLATYWESSRFTSREHWWEVEPLDASMPRTVTVTAPPGGDDQEIRVVTDDWTSQGITVPTGRSTEIAVGDDSSPFLRVVDDSGRTSTPLRLAEVTWPGLAATRRLVLPDMPTGFGGPDAIVLRAHDDPRTGCASVDGEVRCVAGRDFRGEESLGFGRRLSLPAGGEYDGSLRVRGVPGPELERLIQRGQLVDVSASSTGVADPRGSALAAVDGSPGTTWTAADNDLHPSYTLRWLAPQRLRGLQLSVDRDTAARLPQTLTLAWSGGRREVELDAQGRAQFPPITTDELVLRVGDAESATNVGFNGAVSNVPVGITELRVRGTRTLPVRLSRDPVAMPCGSGPEMVVNGTMLATRVTMSPAELMSGASVEARPCGGAVALRAGANVIDVRAQGGVTAASLVLRPRGATPPAPATVPVAVADRGAVERTLAVPAERGLVATTANTNPGWVGSQAGERVEPVVVDGWRQGWRTSGAGEPLLMKFAPDTVYRWGLVIGVLALALLLTILLLGSRGAGAPHRGLGERHVPRVVLIVSALAAGALLAGPWGAGLAACGVVGALLADRFSNVAARGLVAFLVVPALGSYVFRPWGSGDGWAGDLAWPSYLVTALLAGAVVLAGDRRPRSRSPRRMEGISTSR